MILDADKAIELAISEMESSRENILRSFGSAMGYSVDMDPTKDSIRESAYVAGYRQAAHKIATRLRAFKQDDL